MAGEAVRKEEHAGFSLWEVQEGEKLTREIRDVPAFRKALGDDLIVGFAQLFNAVGRLDALLSLMFLNNAKLPPIIEGDPDSAHDPDSTGANRNRIAIGVLIWGTFHEVIQAVTTLQAGRLTELLSKRRDQEAIKAWKRLRTLALRWRANLETSARNQFAAHLGDAAVMKLGLSKWPKDETLFFSTADRTNRVQTMFHVGFSLLTHGLGMTDKDFERLAEQGVKDHLTIADDALATFFGAMHAKGAPIASPSEIMRAKTGSRRGK